jgi:hypothetical protein
LADGLEDIPCGVFDPLSASDDSALLDLPYHDLWSLGRCKALASSHGARIQTSRSSFVVRITGNALGRIGATIAFEAAVGKP